MAVSISLSITQNSQSITNNTSNVTVKVNYSWTYGSFNRDSSTKYVTINGTKYSFNDADINPNATTSGSGTLYTKTLDIKHNTDGTGKVEVSAYVDTDVSSGILKKSATKTLTTIPRASTITATSAVVGSESTITISRKSSKFTHTLKYSFGSLSGTIVSKTTSTSYKWKLPTSFYAQIGASATSKSGTITCETFDGSGNSIGTKSTTFTAKTSSATCAPTLSPIVMDSNATTKALTGNAAVFVKYYSNASITYGAEARNSATLKSVKVVNSGQTKSSTSGTASTTINGVTSGDFDFTATDSRGYSKTLTVSSSLVPYVKLSASTKATATVDGTMTIKVSGNYYNGSFGAAANTLTVEYRYKISGGSFSSWTAINPTYSGNTYSATATVSGLDYQETYTVETRATDKLATVSPGAKSVKALPVFDWGENDFNHNTDLTLAHGKALQSFSSTGAKTNMAYITSNENLMIGGGSYPPPNIYMRVADGGRVLVGNTGTYINLLGAARAMTTTYKFDTTIEAGNNWKDCTATVHLIGNCLRLSVNAKRKTAASVGNITNEIIMKVSFNHGGKIDEVYRVDFPNGMEGGLAGLDAQTSTSGETTTITVRLCSTTTALEDINAYTNMPVNINLSYYN